MRIENLKEPVWLDFDEQFLGEALRERFDRLLVDAKVGRVVVKREDYFVVECLPHHIGTVRLLYDGFVAGALGAADELHRVG